MPRFLTPKAWPSSKKTGFKSERTRVQIPLVPLEGGKCNFLYKCFLNSKVFPVLDWGTIPSP